MTHAGSADRYDAEATVADVVSAMSKRYPTAWAEDWDRVGLVVGDPAALVRRILLVIDCVPETLAEAIEGGADMIIAHHPLLLRGVHSVAATTYKGSVVHQLIRAGIALHVAHTNADVAEPGVSGALAGVLELRDSRPLVPGDGGPAGSGRIGLLPHSMTVAELASYVAARLPATFSGVRAAGDPDRRVTTLAVMGGAGDSYLRDAVAAGVDAYLTADLRHHPASEHLAEAGPALVDAAHWATERPWLDLLANELAADLPVDVRVSDFVTDVWRVHAPSPNLKEPSP